MRKFLKLMQKIQQSSAVGGERSKPPACILTSIIVVCIIIIAIRYSRRIGGLVITQLDSERRLSTTSARSALFACSRKIFMRF